MPDQEEPEDWESFFSLFPHGVIVLKEDTIVHAVGYPQPATQADADQLRTELASDSELGLTDLRDYHIVPLSGAEWRKYVTFFTGDES
jgi:hypothetical protein